MDRLSERDLTIDVSTTPDGTVRLDWRGKSNDREPNSILAPFFNRALDVAEDQGTPIEMHFERLDHFNSSTITSLIQLIQTARSRDVRLIICYDGRRRWQQLSFDALRIFEKPDGLLVFRADEITAHGAD